MGGRGQRSNNASGGITVGTDKIEFTGDLRYYDNDSNFTQEQRTAIDTFENKRVKGKVEYGTAIASDGTVIGEKRGGKGSVSTPKWWERDGAIFSHIHPREEGLLGGTFSLGDINVFANGKYGTMRASAKEGTYSMSKLSNFDGEGLKQYARQLNVEMDRKADVAYKACAKAIKDGTKYEDALKQYYKEINTAFTEWHDGYKAGESKYGYYYTLEKRK